MTENATERVARPEEIVEEQKELAPEVRMRPLRCQAGSMSADGGCQREGTSWQHPEERDYPLCDEHARVEAFSNEVNDLGLAEEVTRDWLRIARGWGIETLEQLAENAHESAKEDYLKAHARFDLAVEIADAPRSGDKLLLTREQEEKLREVIRRGDSLNDAYTTVEDAPEERLRDEDRRRILAELAIERDKAWAEAHRYKAELGLEVKVPEPESGEEGTCG